MWSYLNQNPAITSLIILSISSLLVFIGWKVIYHNAKKIAARNETFNLVSKFLINVDKLTSASIIYWTSNDNDNDNENLILKSKKFELEIVSLKRSLEQLKKRGLNLSLDLEIRKLRRAITLDSTNKKTLGDSLKLLKVEDMFFYSDELQNKIMKSFEDIH